MQRLFIAVTFIATTEAAVAQSDLQKIGKFLEGIQQLQQQQNNRPPNRPPQNGGSPSRPNATYPQNNGPRNTYPQYRPSQPAPRRTYSNQPIVISCDSESGGICDYKLVTATNRAYSYKIKSGQVQHLKENTDWALMYRPTSANSWKTYNLRGGRNYELRHENGQWQLYMLQ